MFMQDSMPSLTQQFLSGVNNLLAHQVQGRCTCIQEEKHLLKLCPQPKDTLQKKKKSVTAAASSFVQVGSLATSAQCWLLSTQVDWLKLKSQ
jgi:hypothetical protein